MGESGEHKIEVLALLKSFEKKLDMLIGMMQSFNQRQSQLEERMSAHDGREVEIGNGAVNEDGR